MRKVVSIPTKPNGDQHWRCEICGDEMSYSQPIPFDLALEKLKAFMDEHNHPEEAEKEVPRG